MMYDVRPKRQWYTVITSIISMLEVGVKILFLDLSILKSKNQKTKKFLEHGKLFLRQYSEKQFSTIIYLLTPYKLER